jgi:hypothetical protein
VPSPRRRGVRFGIRATVVLKFWTRSIDWQRPSLSVSSTLGRPMRTFHIPPGQWFAVTEARPRLTHRAGACYRSPVDLGGDSPEHVRTRLRASGRSRERARTTLGLSPMMLFGTHSRRPTTSDRRVEAPKRAACHRSAGTTHETDAPDCGRTLKASVAPRAGIRARADNLLDPYSRTKRSADFNSRSIAYGPTLPREGQVKRIGVTLVSASWTSCANRKTASPKQAL